MLSPHTLEAPPVEGASETAQLRRILRVQREVTLAARDRAAALQLVADRAVALFDAADGAVVELADGDALVYAAAAGTTAPHVGTRVSLAASLSGIAARTGRPLACVDADEDPRVDRVACRRVGVGSMLVAPLIGDDGRGIGVLKVSSAAREAFAPAELDQLELLAESLSAALQHAEDFAALQRANRELEEADRLKLDLIGMIGHEVGTPLAAIRGYTDVLREDWHELPDRERERILDVIVRQTGRLDHLQREVLTMVTLDAGALRVDRHPIPLFVAIEGALRAAEAHGVAVECPGELLALVHLGHLEQILVNLLTNAAKYAGGATLITAAEVDGRVEVRVRDDGPGVDEAFHTQLFEWATRGHDASQAPGTGLGLYLARGLAIANAGRLRHEPTVPHGATFVLDLEQA